MEIRLLGPFAVQDARGPVAVTSGRQRAVLAALALHAGRPLPVARLIDAVWGADPPGSARNSLQSHVARLRSVLGDTGLIVLEPAGYRLTLPAEQVDAHRFERLLRDDEVDAALALWRGTPLPEFPDEPFPSWAARLAELHRGALLRRVELRLSAGRADEAVTGLHAAADADPCWERGALLLGRALAAAGRRGDAAAALRRHADAVVDQLGMDPSPAVKQLQVALLRGEVLDAPSVVDDMPAATPARVPLRFSSFVGRDAEQARLAALLAAPGLVSVVGPGGVGKTRLVAETVRAGRRVAWVDAADVRGPDDLLQAVAVAVGARLGPLDEPLEAIAAAAARARPIVVLDNCEHLLDAAADVVEALLPLPVRVVVTSQERLRVDGERVLPLGPLTAADGARLFADRAGAATIDDADAAAVAAIVAGLDALPLAIELAATQAAGLGVAALRDRLGDRLDLLTRGRRTGATRHRTLRALVDWSFGLLDDAERRVLCRLASFRGAFTVALAEAVAAGDDVPRARVAAVLASLVDRSLVVRHGPKRFRLLETVRAYAGECLAAGPDAAPTYRRHAAAMVAAAERLDARMHGPDQPEAVREIDQLLPDLRRARLSADPDVLVRLAAAVHRYGYHCQHYEVLAWGHDAVAVTGHPRLPLALAAAATHAWGRGDLAMARELGERALAEAPGAFETYGAHEVLGDVALVTCDAEAGLAHYRAMAAVGRAAGRAAVHASGLVGEALVLAYSGRDEEAVRQARAALAVAVADGNPSALAEAHYGLGEALGDLDPEQALESLATAARIAAGTDDRLFAAASETAAAAIASRHGDPVAALTAFRDVLALWQQAGNDLLQTNALRNLVVLLARVGADEAAVLVDAALPAAAMYPAEAARLNRARAAVTERLGAQRVAAIRGRGTARVVDEALAAIEAALHRAACP